MKNVAIIGSGGFAKEVFLVLKQQIKKYDLNFIGFIDHAPQKNSLSIGQENFPVVPENEFLEKYRFSSQEVGLFIGIGTPKLMKKVFQKFASFNFPNLIDEDVYLDSSVTLGQGNIITRGVVFTVDITIGSFNVFNLNSTVGHDTHIGDFNVINPLVAISGGVNLGNENLIGVGSTILQYLSVGDSNIIGANGLLTKNVTKNKTMVGVPCKELIKDTK
jgi:sugar O-acyltransferase (sialic acid O-acetyltransferase NeuD family)